MTRVWLAVVAWFFVCGTAEAQYYNANQKQAASSINLIVNDVNGAFNRIERWADQNKAKVVQVSRSSGENVQSANVTVETANVSRFLSFARGLGDVTNEASNMNEKTGDAAQRVSVSLTNVKNQYGYGDKIRAFVFAGVVGALVQQNGIENTPKDFLGGGLSVSTIGRGAQLSIIALKADEDKDKSEDEPTATEPGTAEEEDEVKNSEGSSLVLISHNVYSSLLGGGLRTFINPFAGVSYGLARFGDDSLYTIGANLGLDLIKAKWCVWSLTGSTVGFYTAKSGGNGAVLQTTIALPF